MKVEWKSCLRVAVCAFVLYLCVFYWSAVSGFISTLIGASVPLIVGAVIAYVLNILMSFYEKHYFKKQTAKRFVQVTARPVCMVAAIVTLCAIIALVVGLVVPELVSCLKFIVSEIPPAINKLLSSEEVKKLLSPDTVSKFSSIKWDDIIAKGAQILATGIGTTADALISVISSTVSVVTTSFVGIIFAIYLLLSKDRIISQCKRLVKTYAPQKRDKIHHVLSVFNTNCHKYIVGQCTEAVILGLLCMGGMMLFRFPYAAMIGALVGFTALIPVAGAYIGAIVGALMILTVSPIKALLFIVFIIVLQNLEGNLIYPRVVGNSIGLPAIWVLAAITVGGGLFGILGMLCGVPVTASLYCLLREDVAAREAKQKRKKTD